MVTIHPTFVTRRKDRTAFVALSSSKSKAIREAFGCFHPQRFPTSFQSSWIWGPQAAQFTKRWWRDCLSSRPHHHLSDGSLSRDLLGQEKHQQHVLAHRKVVGEVVHGRIGVDRVGFREDWALDNVKPERRAKTDRDGTLESWSCSLSSSVDLIREGRLVEGL